MSNTEFFELRLTEDKYIRGFKHRPTSWNGKVVIILNGYRSAATSGDRQQRILSLKLVNEGFNVVRFDYIGYGESDGDFSEANITSMISNTEFIIEHVISNYDDPEIILLGGSMGGLVTLATANKNKYTQLKRIILNCPALDFYDVYINQGFKEGLSTPMTLVDEPSYIKTWEEDLALYKDQLNEYTFNGKAIIFHGTTDPVIPYQPIKEFSDRFNIELISIENVDHGFKQETKGPKGIRKNYAIIDTMYKEVSKFLA